MLVGWGFGWQVAWVLLFDDLVGVVDLLFTFSVVIYKYIAWFKGTWVFNMQNHKKNVHDHSGAGNFLPSSAPTTTEIKYYGCGPKPRYPSEHPKDYKTTLCTLRFTHNQNHSRLVTSHKGTFSFHPQPFGDIQFLGVWARCSFEAKVVRLATTTPLKLHPRGS